MRREDGQRSGRSEGPDKNLRAARKIRTARRSENALAGRRSGGENRLAAQLGDGVSLDLANSLRGDAPERSDVGELGLPAVDEAVAATYDIGGTLVELVEQRLEALVLLGIEEYLVRTGHRLARDQVAEGGVATFLHRGVQADMVATVAHQVEHAVRLQPHFVGDLGELGLATETALQGSTHRA